MKKVTAKVITISYNKVNKNLKKNCTKGMLLLIDIDSTRKIFKKATRYDIISFHILNFF